MRQPAALREVVRKYLEAHRVLVLCTHGPEGPWASPVYYASDSSLSLYFFSDPQTRHGRNLARSGWASGAVTEEYERWEDIQGVQLEGPVDILDGSLRQAALQLYLGKYPWAAAFLSPEGPYFTAVAGKVVLYRLRPARVGFTDNRLGFGHREWLELAESLTSWREG